MSPNKRKLVKQEKMTPEKVFWICLFIIVVGTIVFMEAYMKTMGFTTFFELILPISTQ